MKKVTTTITRKTPSVQSTTRSVTTRPLQNAREPEFIYKKSTAGPSTSQQPKKIRQVSSRTSTTSTTAGGGQRTRTEEQVTTISQAPLNQARGSRPGQQQQQNTTYAAQQQQRQRQAQQAQQPQTGIPRMQMNLPREIANLDQQQYMQLMASPQLPQQRQQVPQYGGQRATGMQQPGFQSRMQQPQAGGSRARQQQPQASGIQRPGFRPRIQQPQAGGTGGGMLQPRVWNRVGVQQTQPEVSTAGIQATVVLPGMQQPPGWMARTTVVATAAPPGLLAQVVGNAQRQAGQVSPRTREFEMLEALSPDTMRELMLLEQADARPRERLSPMTDFSSAAAAQYQQLLSPSNQQPGGAARIPQHMLDSLSPGTMREMMLLEQADDRPRGRHSPMTDFSSAAAAQYQQLLSPSNQQPGGAARTPQHMLDSLSPGTMREMMLLEQADSRPRGRLSPMTDFSSAAAAQYQQLLSPYDLPPGPMQQPRYPSGSPRQVRQPSPTAQPTAASLDNTRSIPTAAVGQPTSLEVAVEEALTRTVQSKPRTPLKATGELQRLPTFEESPGRATVMTPTGLKPAETQLLLEGTVKRTANEEIVSRHVVAVAGGMVDERETVQLTPGKGMKRPKTPQSVELIVCSSEVKMAAGYRETTSTVFYETTDDPPMSASPQLPKNLTPTLLSNLITEETADVEKTLKLHAPDLKHSSALTYNIKKRINALQLNKDDVQELEKSITWPSPRADQAQDDPQPELLASMMHTEEKGLAMGSTPEYLYSALFGTDEPMKVEEGTVQVNSVAEHPLNDVVVPSAPATRNLHIATMTPELAHAAINVQNGGAEDTDARPSDGAFTERVLGDKKEAMEQVKGKNVAQRDGPPVKYPAVFDMEALAPWEVDKIDAVVKQIGAIPTSILEASVVGPSDADAADELRDFSVDGIEYLLNMDQVSHQSNVQLRGSSTPSWFPGYYLALGTGGNTAVTIARSPSLVLLAAYNAVQPDMYNDESIISV